jgi:hypothetical protein
MGSGLNTDYTGRSVDLSVVQMLIPDASQAEILDFSNPVCVVAGPQKAAQNWAIHFLTRRGTVIGDDQYGTLFLTQLLENQITDTVGVQQQFNVAAQDILNYTQNRLTGTEKDDEVVINAVLLPGWDFDRPNGRLTLIVGLTLRSGALTQVLLPVPVFIV